jgi:glycosyltransferase involved in cell wall biosynthesis
MVGKEKGKENLIEEFPNSKVCFFSNFPPKECGIATFTKHLSSAMDKQWNPKVKSKVIAVNDEESFYDYSSRVIHAVSKNDIEHYIDIAKRVNESDDIKIVCIQHEFGIFGGEYGSYIVPFLEALQKPVVVTFHTTLPNPDAQMKRVVQSIAKRSSAMIVLAKAAANILVRDYGVEKEKIRVVYHGIENVPFQSNEAAKKKFGLDKKTVLLTLGLLSRGKGIEYMIQAMPKLVKKYPNILYLVVGETHPAVRKNEGEEYRNGLIALAKKLGVEKNVKFYNKYVSDEDVIQYMIAADIYVGTNLERNQISSGPIAESLGYGGKAVVSTPTFCAEELLADGRGMLAEFKNPDSFANVIDKILSNPEAKKEMERLAYAFSRQMTWRNVAIQYLRIFNEVVKLREETIEKFPKIKLNHIRNLTDEVGMIQFCRHSTPDKNSGYTLDDNARALIFAVQHSKLYDSSSSEISSKLSKIYLQFLEKAQEPDGNFKNNISNEEEITKPHSQDSFGRAIWALGFAINNSKDQEIKEKARYLFDKSFKYIDNITSPRAKAFCILGLGNYYQGQRDSKSLSKLKQSADYLISIYNQESSKEWHWFESVLTYSNSTIPESLFFAYNLTSKKEYLEIARKTLDFLTNLMFINGEFCPIGQNGWYNRHGERAFFDQQPLDVSGMVLTYLTAFKTTKEKDFYNKSVLTFNWFLGKNHLKQMMYDEATGGCYDGLGKNTVNLNQGAESTISYLTARIFLEELKKEKK